MGKTWRRKCESWRRTTFNDWSPQIIFSAAFGPLCTCCNSPGQRSRRNNRDTPWLLSTENADVLKGLPRVTLAKLIWCCINEPPGLRRRPYLMWTSRRQIIYVRYVLLIRRTWCRRSFLVCGSSSNGNKGVVVKCVAVVHQVDVIVMMRWEIRQRPRNAGNYLKIGNWSVFVCLDGVSYSG